MRGRLAVQATLVTTMAFLPASVSAAPQGRPPMFSRWYVESVSGVLNMEPVDAARLERKLAANPEDLQARLNLMVYYQRADRAANADDRAKRVRSTLWLIEHHPDSEILHASESHFAKGELSPADYKRAAALWDAASKTNSHDAALQWNAASFFRDLDIALYVRYLEATAAADPNHPFAIRPLAGMYASSILDRGPLTPHARAALDASGNVWVVSNAAYLFQCRYNETLQRGTPDMRAAELAEHYFVRAKALDPNLDRQKILPQIDMNAVRRTWAAESDRQRNWAKRAAAEVAKIRRLQADAFPGLPPAIAGVLRARNCKVPQPFTSGAPRNVIEGEFFENGETSWAVLCSIQHSTALLVFRNDTGTKPHTLNTTDDSSFLQGTAGDSIGYSREITPVGRGFIMRHYRGYGGPKQWKVAALATCGLD